MNLSEFEQVVRLSYRVRAPEQSDMEVDICVRGMPTLEEMLEAYEGFLRAIGYVFDGTVQIVEEGE